MITIPVSFQRARKSLELSAKKRLESKPQENEDDDYESNSSGGEDKSNSRVYIKPKEKKDSQVGSSFRRYYILHL